MSSRTKKLSDADYARLADFRHALRCFLEFSETAAAEEGLTPQQHQALLVIRGSESGLATVGRLAERLRIRHNTAVELANRLETAGMIVRTASATDRRAVELKLSSEGAAKLEVLSWVHRNELNQLRPGIVELFNNMEAEGEA